MSESRPLFTRAPVVLAALGIISGLLTYVTYNHLPGFLESELLFAALPFFVTGMYFAAVMGFAIHRFATKSPFAVALTFVISIVAWRLAYGATSSIYDMLQDDSAGWLKAYGLETAGLCGGFIGSALTVVAVAIAGPNFRRPASWAITIAIGTIAGILVGLDERMGWPTGNLVLFVVWQAAVAASIGYGLVKPAGAAA